MNILLTGGAGFIGSHLAEALLYANNNITVLDDLSTGKKENLTKILKNIEFIEGNISNRSLVSKIFNKKKFNIICHFAAQKNVRNSIQNPIFDAKVNILGSLNLLESAKKYGVQKIIFASSGGAIYGEAKKGPQGEDSPTIPLSPYGIGKLTTEKYLEFYNKEYGINFVSLRYSNVYGPRQDAEGEAGVIAIFCNKIKKQESPTIFGDGNQSRDFVYIDDVVEATIRAMASEYIGCINIATETETSINDLFKLIKKISGFKAYAIYEEAIYGEQRRSILSIDKAKKIIKFSPKITLEKGISNVLASI